MRDEDEDEEARETSVPAEEPRGAPITVPAAAHLTLPTWAHHGATWMRDVDEAVILGV